MEYKEEFDVKAELAAVIKSFNDLSKCIKAFNTLKPEDNNVLDKLEKAINQLPSTDTFANALKENVDSAKKIIEEIKFNRAENFKKYEVEYIKGAKASGKSVRELSGGWRVGRIEIKVRPELSKICLLYNGEKIIDWSTVNSSEDFLKLEEKANKALDDAAIDKNELSEILFSALNHAIYSKTDRVNGNYIPIKEFYREFRISRIRRYLESKGSNANINKVADFPVWAFLYNIDLFRTSGLKLPDNSRLALQTGSMQETSHGKGYIVNGLNADDEYKVMCYVFAVKGGAGN